MRLYLSDYSERFFKFSIENYEAKLKYKNNKPIVVKYNLHHSLLFLWYGNDYISNYKLY